MTLMQIHQFHSGTAQGDAITNQMLYLQHFFQGKGYASEIYAEYIPPELKKESKVFVSIVVVLRMFCWCIILWGWGPLIKFYHYPIERY